MPKIQRRFITLIGKATIVLEPLRNKDEYYLLTAYYMEGKDKACNKMAKKWKRRIKEDL